ncbi:methyltransferase family protein [Gordonia insulae]|uniref:Phospholipid methyltransferase n=1 Tax=Gordonia insulae TaxID=2420509 RepID=A0A3G8JTY8_9ACTN|nr:methyltransferase [Gordonia insulae]AZG48175.1 hypothetical protein D7316_04792 [Gordonia insulae]
MIALPFAGDWLDVSTVRMLAVMAPVVVAAGLWLAVTDVRRRGAAVLALLWNLLGLTMINVMAVAVGWWSFGTEGGDMFGLPVDLMIGWAVAWSMLPVLAARWIRPAHSVVALVLLDVYAMPSLTPAVALSSGWWWGEALAVVTCLIPGVVLAEATTRGRFLGLRVVMQMVLFGALLIVAIPSAAMASTDTPWTDVWARIGGPLDIVLVQVAGVVALVAVSAVIEFARHGGTPYPWDPPRRLVTSGPYAYVANPMQLCGTALLLVMAGITGLPALAGAAVAAAAFSSGLAAYVENDALARRFGGEFDGYRRSVRPWWPRWRPTVCGEPARVYLARGCDPCSDLAGWLLDRRPAGLDVRPAEGHREALRRMRYETDVVAVDGVRAFGTALTHLNLVWAVAGWVIATPGIAHVLQVLVDVAGGAPREIARD